MFGQMLRFSVTFCDPKKAGGLSLMGFRRTARPYNALHVASKHCVFHRFSQRVLYIYAGGRTVGLTTH